MTALLNRQRRPDWHLAPISIIALLVCLFYAYANSFLTPLPGFTFDGQWNVISIDGCAPADQWCLGNQGKLQVGDRLTVIGDLTKDTYKSREWLVPFEGYGPGQVVPITLIHGNDERQIDWQMPANNTGASISRLFGNLLLFMPFWLAGTVVLLLLQPRDTRWRLLISFNYLTALWLLIGNTSVAQVAFSALLLPVVSWLMAPVYLHLHLFVPSPLFERHYRYSITPLYVIAVTLAVLTLFQQASGPEYLIGLVIAIILSFGLLAFRFIDNSSKAGRPAARLMLVGIGLAFGPSILLWVLPQLLNRELEYFAIGVALFSIPVLPLFYTYAIYKRHLGGLEFRVNNLISRYSFILLYLTAFAAVFLVGASIVPPEQLATFSFAVSAIFAVAAPSIQRRLRRLFNQLAYGTGYDSSDVVSLFVHRIPAASNREALVALVADEVIPSLLIRQSALYLLPGGQNEAGGLLYARGIELAVTAPPGLLRQLLLKANRYWPPEPGAEDEFSWVRLVIPLELQNNTVGLWLFGRRDPDDYYPQNDIDLLHTLAHQTALAAENSRLYLAAQQELAERIRAETSLAAANVELEQALFAANEMAVSAQAASRAKSEFLATMSHEFRTPLNVVLGYTELVLSTELTEEQQAYLQEVNVAGEGLLKLFNDILDFSRIESGRLELKHVNFDLAETIRQVIMTMTPYAAAKNLELSFSIEPGAPTHLIGDPARLEQVLSNLLNNAIKFTAEGGAGLSVRCVERAADRAGFLFAVTDTGIGIPRDKQEMIFQPFTQADSTVTRQHSGMGLGLSIARRLVEKFGGRLWVESEPGKGSVFQFTIIFEVAPLAAPVIEEATLEDSGSPVVSEAALSILLAEDNLVNKTVIARILEKRGWAVEAVENGQAAVDRSAENHFDLILMDVQMPVLDGYNATVAIRARERATGRHVPIVGLTAYAMQGDRERCLLAGMDAYLAKPMKASDLYEAIEKILNLPARQTE
jgi:signal transduction histidine kinase/ActR/RegA family two-component response regulator